MFEQIYESCGTNHSQILFLTDAELISACPLCSVMRLVRAYREENKCLKIQLKSYQMSGGKHEPRNKVR